MTRFLKFGLTLIGCLCFAATAYGQSQTFYVDDDGGLNTYPTLANAVATAVTFTGNHIIIVSPHSGAGYTDANIGFPLPPGPGIIDEIKGDGTGEVVFDGSGAASPYDFIWMWSGLKISGLRIINYRYGAVATGGATGCVVTDNCFIGNGLHGASKQAYDDAGGNNWDGNYWSDAPFANPYVLDGALGQDNAPGVMANMPLGGPVGSIEVGDEFTLSFEIVQSACDDSQELGAYEFTAKWDPAELEVVAGSFDYDDDYMGTPEEGALYTNIAHNPLTGQLVFAATNFSNPGTGSGPLAHATFRAIGTTASADVDLQSDYRDGDGIAIPVVSGITSSFAIVDTEIPDLVDGSIVPNDPNGDDTYSLLEPLSFGASATDNYCLYQIYYNVDGGGNLSAGVLGGGTSGSVSGVAVSMIGLADGMHTLNVFAQDCAPGYLSSLVEAYTFFVDNTPPAAPTMALTDPTGCALPGYSNDLTVDVSLSGGAEEQMEFWLAGAEGPIPYANPTTYTFPAGDASHILYVRLTDAYGNVGPWSAGTGMIIDQTVPVVVSLTLDGGAAKTGDPVVSYSVPSWGVGYISRNISENPADFVCGNAGWGGLGGPYDFTLSAGDGMKTVYIAGMDEAGNISAPVSDDIELDETDPTVSSVVVIGDGGDVPEEQDCTDTWAVEVTVTFPDADVVWLGLDNGGGITWYGDGVTPLVSPYVASYSMDGAPATDQLITINAQLWDNVAPPNIGTGSDDIYLDYSDPTVASLVISDQAAGGAPLANGDWTNSLTVDLGFTGLSADVTHLLISEDAGFTSPVLVPAGNPYSFSHSATAECVGTGIWVKSVDCSGNQSAAVTDAIWFDLTVPVLASFTGPAMTNTLAVSGLALSATDNCAMWQMQLSEDAGFTGAVWVPFSPAPAFTLAAGPDGPRTIHVRVADAAGNIGAPASLSHVVILDMAPPTGTMVVQQNPVANPLATPGYTDSKTECEAVSISSPDGGVSMQIQVNEAGGSNSGFIPTASSWSIPTLGTNGEGTFDVRIRFRDAALNIGAWVNYQIIFDMTPPAVPIVLSEEPGGSIVLSWTPDPGEYQKYILRYNFSGGYPEYDEVPVNNPPPPPANKDEGILISDDATSPYAFSGVGPDIYSVSLFGMDLAGNVSVSPIGSCQGTNYFLGDFLTSEDNTEGNPDGCIGFDNEFYALAQAYNTEDPGGALALPAADPLWNSHLDIAPTHDGTRLGSPMPDDKVNFEDLVIFALNYNYPGIRCVDEGGGKIVPGQPRSIASAPIAMTAELPANFGVGDEVTIPVSVENASAAVAFRVVLDYNEDAFELVGVNAGEALVATGPHFFYFDRRSSNIDVSGAMLNDNALGDGTLFEVRLRAKAVTGIEMSPLTLTYRDDVNSDIAAGFGVRVMAAAAVPTTFALTQNYPNPFNAGTTIQLRLPVESDYTLEIYNLLGQSVATFAGHSPAGAVNIDWNANGQPSGLYLYRMTAGNFQQTRKMTLLK